MTTLTQSIIDKRKDINAGPDNVIFARLDALNAIQLTKDIFTGNADDFVNRNYAKKILVMLPNQRHPSHRHIKKTESFILLFGKLNNF